MDQNNNKNINDDSLRDLWIGIAISFGAYMFGVSLLSFILGPFALIVTFIANIVAIVISFKKGKKRLAQGLLIGIGVFILLAAACAGILIYIFGG